MIRTLPRLVAALALVVTAGPTGTADACGVKLTIKTSQAHKAVARSSRPSHVLIVGGSARRLERDLGAAGHDVEVVPAANDASRANYAVVVVGSDDDASKVRTKFGSSTPIIVRSGDSTADLRAVENQVARQPVQIAEARTPIKAREPRAPIGAAEATGTARPLVATKAPSESAPATGPVTPGPEAIKSETPKPETPKPETPKPETPKQAATTVAKTEEVHAPTPDHTPRAVASDKLDAEIYFSVGKSSVEGNKASLDKATKWLSDNPDIHFAVEGYADPTGNPDANMALSQSRAESVRDFLVQNGIDASRIDVAAYGDTRLKYGRADGRNRRVAVKAVKH